MRRTHHFHTWTWVLCRFLSASSRIYFNYFNYFRYEMAFPRTTNRLAEEFPRIRIFLDKTSATERLKILMEFFRHWHDGVIVYGRLRARFHTCDLRIVCHCFRVVGTTLSFQNISSDYTEVGVADGALFLPEETRRNIGWFPVFFVLVEKSIT